MSRWGPWSKRTARATGTSPRGRACGPTSAPPSTPPRCWETAGLPASYAEALDDPSWDALLEDETELALSRTGRDVGTPIITFHPSADGPDIGLSATTDPISFFGPVISRVPSAADAVPLWESVIRLATFPGFAEMKRSMREAPQLNILGGVSDQPAQEDWTGGHRAGHLASDQADQGDQSSESDQSGQSGQSSEGTGGQ